MNHFPSLPCCPAQAFHNGGGGIYLDVSSTAVQVTANLVYDVAYAPLHWNVQPHTPQAEGAEITRIINNVFVACPCRPWCMLSACSSPSAFV